MSTQTMSDDNLRLMREMLTRLHGKYAEHLPMWVITDHPTDYPDDYVARLHMSLPVPCATSVMLRRPTIEALRDALPYGLVKLERQVLDDPKIVEVWL